jgi:parallel beta-helix repeat protein
MKKAIFMNLALIMFAAFIVAAPSKLFAASDSNVIYIRPDGSVEPVGAPIEHIGDLYRLTDNVSAVILVQKDNIIIDGNGYWVKGDGAGYGFDLTSRSNVTITNCTIANFLIGIHAYFSMDIFVINNHIKLNIGDGLQIISSNKSSVIDNDFIDNSKAISLNWSPNSNLSGNLVSNNYAGILVTSSTVTMKNNTIIGNRYNFAVEGDQIPYLMNDIDASNTINGKPIYYWTNKQNMEIPPDAGYVAIINSTNITVNDLTLTNNNDGVLLYFTSNSIIRNVTSLNNLYGFTMFWASNNTITECKMEMGDYGFWLMYSSNNSIVANKIINNYCGVQLIRSSGNKILHNDFFSYEKQVETDSSLNVWDDGYPSGGNHWSDYVGADLYSGPHQNLTGSDGIGDTPYPINADNKDNYPFMEPWSPPEDKTPPTIETPSYTPSEDVPLNQEVTVTVNVTDTESEVKNVTLSYKLGNATSWTDLLMNYNETSHLYEIIIPGQPNQTSVSFKITAFDNAENMATKDNAGEYYVYSVVPEHFALIALLLFMIVLSLIIVYAKRKSVGTKSPSVPDRKYTSERL